MRMHLWQIKMKIDTCTVLIFSAVLRVLLIIFGEWQDAHMEVRYTDVDYIVFSDAASLMASGRSPYERSTYRYSPLLAFLLIPNCSVHHSWGKLLFSASDLLTGWLIRSILNLRGVPENICTCSVVAWLLNPFTFTIGTRGNCEPIVSAMVLWIILCLLKGKIVQSAFWYGLVVHFRIYPIIYALPILLVLDPPHRETVSSKFLKAVFSMIFTRRRIIFAIVSGGCFFFYTGFFFFLYRWKFLHEALLYHLGRTDPRHNFSIYFYHIYLRYEQEISLIERLSSFLPQLLVQLILIFHFAWDLPFCFFVQTLAFVAFNKVITAQYFVWFFCLLPLTLPWSKMKLKGEGLRCIAVWVGAEAHWLMWAYLLEFKGKSVFLQVWMASIVFFAANTYVLIMFICYHEYCPIFEKGNRIRLSCFDDSTSVTECVRDIKAC